MTREEQSIRCENAHDKFEIAKEVIKLICKKYDLKYDNGQSEKFRLISPLSGQELKANYKFDTVNGILKQNDNNIIWESDYEEFFNIICGMRKVIKDENKKSYEQIENIINKCLIIKEKQ